MKKFVLVSGLLTLGLVIAAAQADEATTELSEPAHTSVTTAVSGERSAFAPSRINILGGIAGSNWERRERVGTWDLDFEPRTGGYLGVSTDWGHRFVVVETGLAWRRMGTVWDSFWTGADFTGEFEVEADYLTIPVHAKIFTGEKVGRGFFFRGGFIPSFLLSSQLERRTGSFSTPSPDISGVRKFDLLFSLGIGGNIPTGPDSDNWIILGADYNRGLVNVIRIEGKTVYNSALLLTAGLAFSLR